MALKKTVEIDDVVSEGEAVADIVKIFSTLQDDDAVGRVAIAAAVLCGTFTVDAN